MTEQFDRFKIGISKLFSEFPQLHAVAMNVWTKLQKNSQIKTITLSTVNLDQAQDLFLNCAMLRNDKIVLNVDTLRKKLGEEFTTWQKALQETGHFQLAYDASSRNNLLSKLHFEIPDIDWDEFKSDITKNIQLEILKDAYKAAKYLASCPKNVMPAELGARLFCDSKRLKNETVLKWLCRFLRQQNGVDELIDDRELLNKFGLVENPTASLITVYGPFEYWESGRCQKWIKTLWEVGQSATLSGDNLKNLEQISIEQPVLTIENETVFNLMKTKNSPFALVYTAGFPGRAVRQWIQNLPAEAKLLHWGDGDPEGYEIANILNSLHPLKLFRCDVEGLDNLKKFAKPLPESKMKRAQRLISDKSFPFSAEIAWILQNNCWIEQESFFSE